MSGARLTILLVDDSDVLRRMAAAALANAGDNEVDQAVDAVQALEMMVDKDYDVVITDHYMPGLDGVEFVRRIKRRPDGDRIPVIMVTTEKDPFVEQEARASGVDEFLTKPFDPLTIREVLERLTQAKKAPAISLRIDAQALLDSFPYPAMVLDRHHNVILGNVAFWRGTGSGIDDCGLVCSRAMHASGRPPGNCPLDESSRTGAVSEALVVEGGTHYEVTVYPMALTDDEGQVLYLHVARPVAARRAAG